jgi:hypothetical protein
MGQGSVRNLMQAAVKIAVSRNLMRCLLAVALVAAGAGYGSVRPVQAQAPSAQAPSVPADGPPIAISGWRYEKGASDIHLFHCDNATCVPGSRVSYRFYAPGTVMPLEQFRREQEVILKALQQRAPPGSKITIVAIEGDEGASLPRMYKVRRLTVAADGSQEHVHSGLLMGDKASVSLISSSRDEKAAGGNYGLYALGLMLSVQMPRDTKK